jgi:hypothetical protein
MERIAGFEMSYLHFNILERDVTKRGPALFSIGRVYVETQKTGQSKESRVLRFSSVYTDEPDPCCLALHVSRMGEKTIQG